MKKRLIVVLSSLAIVLASFAVSLFANRTDEVFEANLEALASVKPNQTCYFGIREKAGSQVLYCPNCTWLPGTSSIWYPKGDCSPNE